MKISRYALALCVALILSLGTSFAHAAVGTLTCTSNTGNVTANLSYFDLGFSRPVNIGSATGGAGAGKITDTPLEIHTSLVNFQEFWNAVERAENFSKCTLTTEGGGSTIEFSFSKVEVSSVDAIAQSPRNTGGTPLAYLDVKLVYSTVAVKTTTTTDDGGTDSWDQTQNKAS